MKQVKQIIEFILVVASCFFWKRKQQKINPHVPEDPYPPGPCNGGKGDCPGCSGCNCNPESATAGRQTKTSGQYGPFGNRYQPAIAPNKEVDGTSPSSGAANLLGWCLIAVAGTSYLYKLLV